MGSYDNQSVLPLPWKPERLVGIDNCILNEITGLWEKGVRTLESCCGHNKKQGYVAVDDLSIPTMIKLGYLNQPLNRTYNNNRSEIFILKTTY